jgi:hypothetical protein
MNKFRLTLIAILLVSLRSATLPAAAQVPTSITVAAVTQQVEAKVRGRLETQNLRVEVMPFDDDTYTQQGRFQWIMTTADSASQEGIVVRDLLVKAFDVTLDLPPLFDEAVKDVATISSARTILTGRIYESDMQTLLTGANGWAERTTIQDMKVGFAEGSLKFTGKYKMLFGSDIEMTGILKVRDHRAIDFEPTSAKINNLPLPAGPLKTLLSKMNPLVDFSKVILQPTIEAVTIPNDYILLSG